MLSEKTCGRCKNSLPIDSFGIRRGKRAGPHGRETYCRPCRANIGREWRQNPENYKKYKHSKLTYDYGLSLEEFDRLLVEQQGRCAICGKEEAAKLHVDHDHETKEVRGLLCGPCNRALGLFKDDPGRLVLAAEYLRRKRFHRA